MTVSRRRADGYEVSTDPARLDLDFVRRELAAGYWSPGVPREVAARAAATSLAYRKFGWKELGAPERWMERHFPKVYVESERP